MYSEKATKFCEISTVDLTNIGQIYGGDFTKYCDLLRIYELYQGKKIYQLCISGKQPR